MYSISKTFSFCYGHRLIGDTGKCGGLHGHTARVAIKLAADELDDAGMVWHFDQLKQTIGAWIDENLDHAMILARNDPLVDVLREAGERIVTIDNSPTAENLARHIFDRAVRFGIPVIAVDVWESATSKATYAPLSGQRT